MKAQGRDLVGFCWLFVVLALAVALPTDALAHASLVRSAPADGAILEEAPQEIRLWFDEDISPVFSSARLFDSNSQPLTSAGIRTDPADPKLLIVVPNELSNGVYSVLARVLSEADGHFSRRFLVFGIGADLDLGTAPALDTETAPPMVEIVLRWINFTLLATLIGAIAVSLLVLAPARTAAAPALVQTLHASECRVLALALWCGGLSLLTGIGLLLWQTLTLLEDLPENAAFAEVAWQNLSRTRWGAWWLVRETVLLVLCGCLLGLYQRQRRMMQQTVAEHRRSATLWSLALLAALALLAVQALTGHAAGLSDAAILAVVADILHLLAASVWVGGLFALALGLLPLMLRQTAEFNELARVGWGAFSRWAALCVGLLLATGLYNMGQQVASVDALLTTLYGQTLLVKIGLVLAVGVFGLLNTMLLHPSRVAAPLARLLRRAPGWKPASLSRLPLQIRTEAGLALLVLLATAVVTATQTPRKPEFKALPAHIPSALSQTVEDVVVTLLVKPNRPGQNVLTVFAASTHRPPPAEIIRVLLRFTYLEQDLGRVSVKAEEVERARYLVSGNHLSQVGDWQVDVVIRRKGMQDSVASFQWLVPPPGEPRPVLISKSPLAPVLTAVAAGFILSILLLLCLFSYRNPALMRRHPHDRGRRLRRPAWRMARPPAIRADGRHDGKRE